MTTAHSEPSSPGSAEERAQARWDRAFATDHADQAAVSRIYTLASPLYWRLYGNRRFGNTGAEYGCLSWMKRVYGSPRPHEALDLGCGTGDLLVDLRQKDFADRYTGIDFSETGLQAARERVANLGFENVAFARGNLNDLHLERARYDVVTAQMTIHHVENLEGLFEEVARALTHRGVFVINEYVGPTRWQFKWTQVLLANALLALLPRRLRISHPDGAAKRRVPRSTVAQMMEMDPSESVRSGEIERIWRRFFTVEHRIDYGGSVSVLVLDTIVSNFRDEDSQSVRWFRRVLWVDHWARRLRLVPAANVVLAGRPLRFFRRL